MVTEAGEEIRPLAGRYLYRAPILAGGQLIAWVAHDLETDGLVVASAVTRSRVEALERARGVHHAHLASIIDVVRDVGVEHLPPDFRTGPAAAVAIAEYFDGEILHTSLKSGPFPTATAVSFVLRAARATLALHASSCPHGAISPRSLVIDVKQGKPPILAQLAAPVSGAYSSLERLQRKGPSLDDDSWALHATLFAAVTARTPFSGTSREELVRSILRAERRSEGDHEIDEELIRIIDAGLVKNPRFRASVEALVGNLEGWLGAQDATQTEGLAEDDAGDGPSFFPEGSVPGVRAPSGASAPRDPTPATVPAYRPRMHTIAPEDLEPYAPALVHSLAPPPVEELDEADLQPEIAAAQTTSAAPSSDLTSTRPPTRRKPATPARPSASHTPVILGGLIALALGVALVLGLTSEDARAPMPGEGATASAATGPGSGPPSESSSRAGSAGPANVSQPPPGPPASGFACVASLFPEDTFKKAIDVGFLCEANDLRKTTNELRRVVVKAAAGSITQGMQDFARLGWYELALTEYARRACCPGASRSVDLPPEIGSCGRMDTVVGNLANSSRAELPVTGKALNDAVACRFIQRVPRMYRYEGRPTGHNRTVFEGFLERGEKRGAATRAAAGLR